AQEPPELDENCFIQENTLHATLHVPVGSKERYEAAPVWQWFKKIVEDESLGTVGMKAIRQDAGKEGSTYDLQGRRADEHTKGVVIKNGKKVMRR
ncbi:MAG: hypothetical protein IJ244_03420, partial [Bacteroidaceae bacterium]|nr:hypothetical protein [Bacteroidaceae bacterium]